MGAIVIDVTAAPEYDSPVVGSTVADPNSSTTTCRM